NLAEPLVERHAESLERGARAPRAVALRLQAVPAELHRAPGGGAGLRLVPERPVAVRARPQPPPRAVEARLLDCGEHAREEAVEPGAGRDEPVLERDTERRARRLPLEQRHGLGRRFADDELAKSLADTPRSCRVRACRRRGIDPALVEPRGELLRC